MIATAVIPCSPPSAVLSSRDLRRLKSNASRDSLRGHSLGHFDITLVGDRKRRFVGFIFNFSTRRRVNKKSRRGIVVSRYCFKSSRDMSRRRRTADVRKTIY